MPRKTYILIEHNGEQQLVKSLDGCEGCKVISNRVNEPPSPHHKLKGGKWVEDKEAKNKDRLLKLIREGRLGEAIELLKGE